jgi:amidohydrolase
MNEDEDFVLVQHHDTVLPLAPKYMGEIVDFIQSAKEDLSAVNTKIHDNPEVGYEEHKAHALLTNFLKCRQGWKVTTSAYGIATAWIAVYDSGKRGPVVSFNVEMDALPGLGHACGHNLIATSSLAAALATASVMRRHSLKGKIVLFGTPAEEGGGGKIRLLKAGAYKNNCVDISLISHPGITHDGALTCTSAFASFKCEYFGRASHAARSPWLGINALDALIMAYNALSMLRQQTMPGDVIQGHITDGGLAPNIIHAYAAGTFVVRANTAPRLEELRRKVDACFRAGAEATGARLKVTEVMMYLDHVPNRVLGTSYTRYWNSLSPPSRIQLDKVTRVSASTDQGDISHALPSLSVSFAIPPGPEGMGPHSPEFEKAAGTKEAFGRCLRVGEALAGTAVDVLTMPGLLDEVKEQWKKDIAVPDGSDASL